MTNTAASYRELIRGIRDKGLVFVHGRPCNAMNDRRDHSARATVAVDCKGHVRDSKRRSPATSVRAD